MKRSILKMLRMAMLLPTGCVGGHSCSCGGKKTPMEALTEGNRSYVETGSGNGDISAERRADTAKNGQKPYAVVVTCSDSRVPPEHIFGAGIGDLFVIRTAGNVVGEYELGSIEYGTEHLGAKLVVVLGHTGCGAVAAAMEGGAHGHIKSITDEIAAILPEDDHDPRHCEIANVRNSLRRIRESSVIRELEEDGSVELAGAIYDIEAGTVRFLD